MNVWVYVDEDGVPEVFNSVSAFKVRYPNVVLTDEYPESRGTFLTVVRPDAGIDGYLQRCEVMSVR